MPDLEAEDRKLVTLARSSRARIQAPEGAAVRDTDGRTYAAGTVDQPSFKLTALQAAVAAALSSGAEGIEAALKFAMVATGRHKIVAAKRGYHGRTLGALSATADRKYRAPFEPLPIPADHVAYNDLDALEGAMSDDVAAIVLEPLQETARGHG